MNGKEGERKSQTDTHTQTERHRAERERGGQTGRRGDYLTKRESRRKSI